MLTVTLTEERFQELYWMVDFSIDVHVESLFEAYQSEVEGLLCNQNLNELDTLAEIVALSQNYTIQINNAKAVASMVKETWLAHTNTNTNTKD